MKGEESIHLKYLLHINYVQIVVLGTKNMVELLNSEVTRENCRVDEELQGKVYSLIRGRYQISLKRHGEYFQNC